MNKNELKQIAYSVYDLEKQLEDETITQEKANEIKDKIVKEILRFKDLKTFLDFDNEMMKLRLKEN